MDLTVELRGTTPLMQHNIQLADKTNEFARLIAEITGKRKKTDADELEIAHLEFLGGLYFEPQTGVYVTTHSVTRSWEEAAKVTREGKALSRAIAVVQDKAALVYPKPAAPEELWKRTEHVDRRMVGVSMKRVARTRPIFREWSLSFEAELLETVLDPDDFVRIAQLGGRVEGIGDARKLGYGRYECTVVFGREPQRQVNGAVPAHAVRPAAAGAGR